jgi:polysaccharide biosynthesis transport protein
MYNDPTSGPNDNRSGAGQLVPAAQSSVPATFDPYGPLGGYRGGAVADEPELFGFKLLDYWRILNKRKWLILGITAAFVALTGVRTLMQTPLYTATVRLQIDANVAKIVESGNVAPVEDSEDSEFMRTQYQILQSRTMAERVASALKLGDDPDFLEPREFSLVDWAKGLLRGPPSPAGQPVDETAAQRAAAGEILDNRVVSPVTGSRLVDISYSDPVPARAQRIADAYADAFLASNLDKRFQANASAKTFLEDKIAQLKLRLEESERKMLEFAKQQQIVDVDDKSSIAQNNLASANTALGNLISERTKNEQLWRQVESADAINLPQFLTNSVIDGLRSQRKALAVEYQEKLETFKPSYPEMVQIDNKIKEIDQQLAAEVQTIKDSLKAAYESSLAQENEMKARIETLRQDALDLQNRSIQYNILKREVDTNRELYASLLQRYKEVDVASGVAASNVFVVDHAELPGAPSSPQLFRALKFAFLLGLGGALGVAYLLERIDDKVRSPEQVELVSGLSLLGVIPKVGSVEAELSDPRSGLAEAYRSLGTALQFTTENGLPRTLVITSSGPAEGKSLTSVAIAKHFATIGRRVLLIDADLRNPSLHVKLRRDNSVGFSNYLTGACAPPDVMQTTDVANLAFIASGPLPPNAADLLGSARVHSLLSIGLEVFDLIVVDGPPVMGLADAQLLSSAAAATVFVVGAGQMRTGLVRGALRRLQLSRGAIVGAVLTKYDAKAAGYGYGYGHAYGYGYGYGATQTEPQGLSIQHSGDNSARPQLTDVHGNA